MVISSNANNKFGPSKWIVGPTLGDGVNYTSIATAIADASAAGGGAVYIRTATYVESFTLAPNVILIGTSAGGYLSGVTIDGTITINGAGSYQMSNIAVIPTAAVSALVITTMTNALINGCYFQSSGASAVTCGGGNPIFINNNFIGIGSNALSVTAGNAVAFQGGITGSISLTGTANFNAVYCNITGATTLADTSVASLSFCRATSGSSSTFDIGATSTVSLRKCIVESFDASTNGIIGTGTVQYDQLTMGGSANNIIGTLTRTQVDTLPLNIHSQSEISLSLDRDLSGQWLAFDDGTDAFGFYNNAGSPEGVVAADIGSLCCDTSNGELYVKTTDTANTGWLAYTSGLTFNEDSGSAVPSSGAISILGGPGVRTTGSGSTVTISSVEFNDVSAPQGTNSDTGYFTSGSFALTLPAAPGQGDTIQVGCVTAGVILTANAGQTIRIGTGISSTAGTATSQTDGDSLILRYNAANTRWHAMSVVGTWVVA